MFSSLSLIKSLYLLLSIPLFWVNEILFGLSSESDQSIGLAILWGTPGAFSLIMMLAIFSSSMRLSLSISASLAVTTVKRTLMSLTFFLSLLFGFQKGEPQRSRLVVIGN